MTLWFLRGGESELGKVKSKGGERVGRRSRRGMTNCCGSEWFVNEKGDVCLGLCGKDKLKQIQS